MPALVRDIGFKQVKNVFERCVTDSSMTTMRLCCKGRDLGKEKHTLMLKLRLERDSFRLFESTRWSQVDKFA